MQKKMRRLIYILCGGEHFVKDCPINKTKNVEENAETDLYIMWRRTFC